MADVIEVRGLDELIKRMSRYPDKLNQVEAKGMDATLAVLHESVPPYPPPPPDSTYRRTGTLGRSLGASVSGGKAGTPSIYETKKLGSGYEGRFGTNLGYAEYVIGQLQAAWNKHWWQLREVAEKAKTKIVAIWNGIARQLAEFLDNGKVM